MMMRRFLLAVVAGATVGLGVAAAPATATTAGTTAPAGAAGGWCQDRAVGDEPTCLVSSSALPAASSNPGQYAWVLEQCKNDAWTHLLSLRALWPGHQVTSTGCYYQGGYIVESATVWPVRGPR